MRRLTAVPLTSILLIPVAGAAQAGNAAQPEPRQLQPAVAVRQHIDSGGRTEFTVSLNVGERGHLLIQQPAETPLWLRVLAPDSTWLRELWTEDTLSKSIPLLAETSGDYRIAIAASPRAPGGELTIQVQPDTPDAAAREAQALDAATDWLARNAHSLRSVETGAPLDDLRPLHRILEGVRVVAVGESTHGSHEFQRIGARVAEFLVREMGFTVFALETSEVAARAVNDYVLHGHGDSAAVLAGLAQWVWDTEGFAQLLSWMRSYNSTVPAARRARFAGFDMQYNPGSRQQIVSLLRRVAPERVPATDSLLVILTEAPDPARPDFFHFYRMPIEERGPYREQVDELLAFLRTNRDRFARRVPRAAVVDAVRRVELLSQFTHAHTTPGYDYEDSASGVAIRDRYMAENILRLLETHRDTRVIMYTHSAHAKRDPYAMGYWLGRALGDAYYAFGLSFHRGSFQALRIGGEPPRLSEFTLPAAFQSSVAWYMKRAGTGDLFVDFRSAPRDDPAAEWLAEPRQMRSIGNGYAPGNPSGYYRAPVVLGRSFDGIIFIEETTRARPNPTVAR